MLRQPKVIGWLNNVGGIMPSGMVVSMFAIDPELFARVFSLDDEVVGFLRDVSNKKPENCFHVVASEEGCLAIDDETFIGHARNVYNLIMSIRSKDNDLIRSAVVQLLMSVENNPDLKAYLDKC